MPRSAFLYLLKQELKWNHNPAKKNRWSFVYILLGIIVGLIFYTIALKNNDFDPQYLWYFTYAYPFVIFGISFAAIAKEWKNRMYGWWLSLPYSREKLLQTKLLANWLQVLQIFLFTIATLFLTTLYGSIVSDTINQKMVFQYTLNGFLWFGIMTLLYPIVATLSYLTFLSSYTRFKIFTPYLWILLILTVNSCFWIMVDIGEQWLIRVSFSTIVYIFGSWIIAWGIYKICVRWLEKEMVL